MHAGWPLIDETIYMLYEHPQLYVDVAVLQCATPRPAYWNALKRLVEAGYAERVMLGSDGGITDLRDAIGAIEEADFLSAEQKRGPIVSQRGAFLSRRLDTGLSLSRGSDRSSRHNKRMQPTSAFE